MGNGCGSSSRRALRRAVSLTLETLEGRRLLSVGTHAGNLDGGFGNGGILSTDFPGAATTDVPIASVKVASGDIVVVGTASGQPVMARYNFATGARDATFGVSTDGAVQIPGSVLSNVSSVAVDDDGNLLVGGTDGSNEGAVARYSADGVLDTSFGVSGVAEDGIASSGVGGVVTLNGNVYASVSGTHNFTLVKFDNTGALDGSFGGGAGFAEYHDGMGDATASSIAANGSGVLLAGVSAQVQGPGSGDTGQDTTFVQFDESGHFDSTFNGGQALALLPTLTTVPSGNVRALDVSPGSILAAGNDSMGNFLLIHLSNSGQHDTSFDGGRGYAVTNFNGTSADQADAVGTDSSGNIYLIGQSDTQVGVAKYSATGVPDESYGFNGAHTFATATTDGGYVADDGSVRVIASALNNANDADFAQIQITSTPALDGSFGTGGIALDGFSASANDQGHAVAQQSDGKLVVGGTTSVGNGDQALALVRYNTDGSLDTSFGTDHSGRVTLSVPGYPIAVVEGITITSDQNGGNIVVAFTATDADGNDDIGVVILNPDGTVNQAPVVASSPTTRDDAVAVGLSTDISQSSIYVAGTESGGPNSLFELVTFDMAGGTPTSATFPVHGGSEADSLGGMVVQSNGKIDLAGTSNDGLNPNQAVVVQLLANGTPDTSFNGNGIAFDTLDGIDSGGSVAADADGNVYVGGVSFTALNASVIKFDATGQQDAGFGVGGVAVATFSDGGFAQFTSLAVDSQGRIVGAGTEEGSTENFGVARFNSDGTPDATFDGGSAIAEFPGGSAEVGGSASAISSMGMTIQSDGNIVLAGTTNGSDFAVARFLGSDVSATPPSFTIDGADHTNEGATYTLTLSSSNLGSQTIAHWTINWGDGSAPEIVGDVTTTTHIYADGPNAFTISATANDGQDVPADNTLSVTVVNVAPTLSATGTGAADEGSSYLLNLSANDPGADTIASWSINWGDGIIDSVTGNPSSVTHSYGDNGNYTIQASATDEDGTYSAPNTSVAVANVPPTAAVSGPSSLQAGTSGTFTLGAMDPSAVDQQSNFSFHVDWGDGNVQTFVAPVGTTEMHTYASQGNYTVSVLATDKDGGQSTSPATLAVAVSASQPPPPPVGAQLVSDPLNPGKTELLVTGSTGNDAVLITGGANGAVNVFFAGVSNGSFNPTGRVVINGGNGNDIVILAGLNHPVEVYGGAGNDIIYAGDKGDILVGGDGNDLLIGGAGRDLLIGGSGADTLIGSTDDDILVAGTTSFDNDPASLNAILKEWNSSHSYADRIANLKGDTSKMTRFNARLNGNVFLKADAGASSTVFDDGARDVLTGGAGRDWFLFNSGTGIKDSIVDQGGNETGTDI